RAGFQHCPFCRDHSWPHHRRYRYAVRPDSRRFCTHGPRRNTQLRHDIVRHRTTGSAPGFLRHLSLDRRRRAAGRRVAAAGAPAWRGEGQEMTALLTLDRVSKRIRGLVAVDAVSFIVPQGAIFAVIGPNGAGKTTLFHMIAGAMPPDAGSSTFAGKPVQGLTADAICRRGIARTFQIVRPFPALSDEDNVTIGALLH